jgi:hypothetical protein
MRHSRIAVVTMCLALLGSVGSAQAPSKSPLEVTADSMLKAGNASGALQRYQQLAAADTSKPRFWYGVGQAEYALHHVDLAAAAFERAAASGKMLTAIYNAGAMHARLGHTEQALSWLDKAVTAGFTVPSVFASDSDLNSLRDNPRFQAIVKKAQVAVAPCMADSNARRFDFWVGEWDVMPANASVVVGHSLIQRIAGGCALLENWTASNGSEGKSINTYNATLGQWQQYWVGQTGGLTEYRESTWRGDTLVFLAHSVNAQGAPFLQRLSFSPIAPNTVRQFGELSTDDGKTWAAGYDFHYHRKE